MQPHNLCIYLLISISTVSFAMDKDKIIYKSLLTQEIVKALTTDQLKKDNRIDTSPQTTEISSSSRSSLSQSPNQADEILLKIDKRNKQLEREHKKAMLKLNRDRTQSLEDEHNQAMLTLEKQNQEDQQLKDNAKKKQQQKKWLMFFVI